MRQINLNNRMVILAIVFLFLVGTAQAATFTVNSTLDDADITLGNGLCATAGGNCTLRAAIGEANAFAGTDTIAFAIAGAGVKTFVPNSAFPTIVQTVIIDGWTQGGPGYTGSPLIELDGTNAGAGVTGLGLTTSASTIRGLTINRFSENGIGLYIRFNTVTACYIGTDATGTIDLGNGGDGIYINSDDNIIGGSISEYRNIISGNNVSGISVQHGAFGARENIIIGNYIGTTVSGAAAIPNGEHGIYIKGLDTLNNIIGGTTAGERNVISGNTLYGIQLEAILLFGNPSISQSTTVIGNYIGTDASGSADLGNGSGGIIIFANSSNNTIGGTTAGERNVISGNGVVGVYGGIVISGISTTGNAVLGNYIGTDAGGTLDLGNEGAGIWIDDSSNNQIGDTLAGAGNVIAFNDYGVKMYELNAAPTDGNSIRGNSIFSNDNLGIDLFPLGVTANDTDDADAGANNLQNFPVLTNVINSGGNTNITGSLNSTPSTSFAVSFFSSQSCDSSGYGEGEIAIGSTTVTTDAGGDITFSFSPFSQIPAGRFITATATRNLAPLDTSEFSECVQVTNPLIVVTNTLNSGAGSLRQAMLDANAAPGLESITFNIPGAGVRIINLLSPLPTITDPVVINGASQPGYAGSPLIELNGLNAGATAFGLVISAGNSTIRALAINRFEFGIYAPINGGNTIRGCYIGTDAATGSVDLGNGTYGVYLFNSSNNIVGGSIPAHRNVISGNDSDGIFINAGTGNIISGNYIGTTANGTAALANNESGIYIVNGSSANLIGGTTAGSRNVISGNTFDGVALSGANSNTIIGNYIGTDAGGTVDLGNGDNGVAVYSSSNKIGGTLAGEANVIAFNEIGVLTDNIGTGNAIRGNSIFSNDNLGIDLFPLGVTANDTDDADTGANNLQNFPVLTNALSTGGNTNIQGSLNSTPGTAFTIDFYSGASCDSSGYGEGEVFIGSKTATTDAGGDVIFTFTPVNAIPPGRFIKTTATRNVAPLDTSEFSACSVVMSAGNLTFSAATYSTNENAVTKTISVARTGSTAGQITVDYAASNGTATAGLDYAATSGTLTFLSGETVKTFDIPITNDTLDEPNETVNLTLSNPTSGVSLTPNANAILTIADNDNPPTISITDVSQAEGNSGTTNYTFTVNLSAPSGFNISVNYATANGTATSGTDYFPTAGTLTFSAALAETSKTVTVAVNGDPTVELNETFLVNLSSPVNATFGDNQGLGTIVDDDNPGRFSFSFAPYSGVENTQVLITVARTNGDVGTVSVDYATSGGSATPTSDYTPVADTLIFGDGEIVKTFTVNLLDDPQTEPTENFNIILSNPIGGAILGVPAIAAVNILDNDSGTLLIISGEILKPDNSPLIGATVNLTGAQTATTTTNNLGRYSFPNLAPNGNYAVAPAALGFTFNPISRQYNNLSVNVANANFTATAAPTRQLRIVGGNATPTQNITAKIELVAQGDENSAGFSLDYDAAILTNPTAVLGADAAGGFITVNPSAAGKVGILLALPAGQTFAAGTRQIATVTFNTLPTNVYNSPVTFGNVPIVKEVSNANADPLPTVYLDGTVTFAQGWEADVAPRPTGNNTGSITITDFTQTGRFVAGLDSLNPNFNEFQRADSAPRISLGSGSLTVSDYTQAGRYAAGIDVPSLTGGQYAPNFAQPLSTEKNSKNPLFLPTVVRVVNAQASGGTQVTVALETDAQGTENGFGFTLNYDSAKLSNPLVFIGAGIPNGSTLIPNTLQTGKVGVVLGLPFGTGLTAGTKQLVTIRFDVAANAAAGNTALFFNDVPVVREVADLNANVLPSTFQDGAINILGATAANVTIGGKVLTAEGQSIAGAQILMSDAFGSIRSVRTNSFGYYLFTEVPAGEIYIFTVRHKQYQFAPQVISVNEELREVNFIAEGETP